MGGRELGVESIEEAAEGFGVSDNWAHSHWPGGCEPDTRSAAGRCSQPRRASIRRRWPGWHHRHRVGASSARWSILKPQPGRHQKDIQHGQREGAGRKFPSDVAWVAGYTLWVLM